MESLVQHVAIEKSTLTLLPVATHGNGFSLYGSHFIGMIMKRKN